ncbi:PKD domain-containing protein [Chitinophaga horti]|uniref:PKD domain-containing protein n=1 Tax=Chitinophaga horti TaxID=2920382 RepID=A0ABY6J5J5_9BACT|nr:PKD domain-containing protein [Chitinophaga horti]UYQ93512.1 PKD domain-containing protein [Chitinophaga horti]
MSKFLQLVLCCMIIHSIAAAYHIIGGEIYYQTVGISDRVAGYKYKITLKLYRDGDFVCGTRQGCLDIFENPVPINIFNAAGTRVGPQILFYIQETRPLRDTLKNPCLAPQSIYLEVAFYSDTVHLPAIPGGYYIAYQRCCRGESLTNIHDSEREGSTFYTVIPGTEGRPNNNCAFFDKDEAVVICAGLPLRYDYSAYDGDGDSLVYGLCNALAGGAVRNNETITAPPYSTTVSYVSPYSGLEPMGGSPKLSISSTGLITGTPDRAGKFVVTVCVTEFDRRTKAYIGTHSKDILITVYNCNTTIRALVPSVLNNCIDEPELAIAIPNNSNAGFTSTYHWYFGDGTDTITYNRDIFYHAYADTGSYKIRLVVNRGLPCTDSTTGVVNNFPGFKAGFTADALCREDPVYFQDTSSYQYGTIVSRKWDFGVDKIETDVSNEVSPSYHYSKGGVYTVNLHLQSDRGCDRVVTQNIPLYEVNPFAGNDTIIAKGQLFTLQGSGGDKFTWWPSDGLSSPNVRDPQVSGNEDITYVLRVDNVQGCFGYDTINVKYYAGPELYIPNAFSPNGDGQNDRFRFIPVGFQQYNFFRIFNRWGELVYNSIDFRMGWDGNINGRPSKPDTYLWILEGIDLYGNKILRKGTVTLLR